METNFLEVQYNSQNLFLHEEFLEVNYLPDKFMHRDQELILLSKMFIKLLENPFQISRKLLIQGDIGIGKTAIAKIFGKMLINSSEKRHLNLRFVHINCRSEKTASKIVINILHQIECKIPERGFSPFELIKILHEYLYSNSIYILLVLDELNFLQKLDVELIYALTRINELTENQKSYISLIGIVKDLTVLRNLDDSTISTLNEHTMKLKKYSLIQIIDILNQRVEISLREGIFPQEFIEYIAKNVQDSGDIRKGLNIIRNSVKIAELKDHSIVTFDDVHSATIQTIPSAYDDGLYSLSKDPLVLLYCVCLYLKDPKHAEITFSELKEKYIETCKVFHHPAKHNTQIWHYCQTLKEQNLIEIDTVSKNIRGRKLIISLSNVTPEMYIEEILKRLKTIF